MKRVLVGILLFTTAAAVTYLFFYPEAEIAKPPAPPFIGYSFTNDTEYLISRKVEKGQTFATLAESFGVDYEEMFEILGTAKNVYNLEKVVEGKEISMISDKQSGNLRKLVYQIDSESAAILSKNSSTLEWAAEKTAIPYETELSEIRGTIDSSLFLAITESGGDERIALALAEMFAWQIDFAADIRTGDSFRAIYEKRFLNGNYVAPGNILAARFTNDNKEFNGVYFTSSDGKNGYYDLDGLSLQKIFLKSPLSYKYISSGFSYNRLNPVTRSDWGPHRAIDYAAPAGTSVTSVGEGTVMSSGWNSDLGIAVFVRHNETYTTAYGHLSRTAVKRGAKVKQGQIIGYVGATGLVTGPHLHYEIRKFGTRVNPLTLELPPGNPVAEKDRAEFQKTVGWFSGFF